MVQPLQIIPENNRKERIRNQLYELRKRGKLTETEMKKWGDLWKELREIEEKERRDSKKRTNQKKRS